MVSFEIEIGLVEVSIHLDKSLHLQSSMSVAHFD